MVTALSPARLPPAATAALFSPPECSVNGRAGCAAAAASGGASSRLSSRGASIRILAVSRFAGGCPPGSLSAVGALSPSWYPTLSASSNYGGLASAASPSLKRSMLEQSPPDLASYLLHNRIVYLGMPLVPAVTNLILAELIYLQDQDAEKPISLYINSTGSIRGGEMGCERAALAIYDILRHVRPPISTLCVGNAWGEAALILAAGAKGNRAALPSSSIMIREPVAMFQGQATDVDLAREEMRDTKADLVALYSKHTGKSPEQIEMDIRRSKYFSPSEAVEYGLIDKVLNSEDKGEQSIVAALDLHKIANR